MTTYLSRAAVAAADIWGYATRTLSALDLSTTGAFTNYNHNTDLASGATYTPPAKTLFGVSGENWSSATLNVEGYDVTNAAWLSISYMGTAEWVGLFIQDDNQRLRIINDDGTNARDLSCFGLTWT